MNLINFFLFFSFNTIVNIGWSQVTSKIGYPDQIILNVTEDLTTSMAFNWRTDKTQSESKIQITKENSSFNLEQNSKEYIAHSEELVFKENHHWYHSILLEDLEEETIYAYRVGNDDKWSQWMNFKTLSKKDTPLKFIYFGDVQSNIKSLWSRVLRQSIRTLPNAQLVLYGGDIVNRGNNLNEWEEWFDASAELHQAVPVMPASGNHDHGNGIDEKYNISTYWNRQFNLPKNGIKSLEESNYFIDIQHVKFIVLNTEMFETEDRIKREQLEWLEHVLIENKQKWTILLMHHPIFSTKKNRDNIELRSLIKPLIDNYHVDLILQGHDHTYARGKDNIPMENNIVSNATYLVSVSGPKLSQVLEAQWMDKSFSFIQLFHGIEVCQDILKVTTYNVKGDLVDSFVIKKLKDQNIIIN